MRRYHDDLDAARGILSGLGLALFILVCIGALIALGAYLAKGGCP